MGLSYLLHGIKVTINKMNEISIEDLLVKILNYKLFLLMFLATSIVATLIYTTLYLENSYITRLVIKESEISNVINEIDRELSNIENDTSLVFKIKKKFDEGEDNQTAFKTKTNYLKSLYLILSNKKNIYDKYIKNTQIENQISYSQFLNKFKIRYDRGDKMDSKSILPGIFIDFELGKKIDLDFYKIIDEYNIKYIKNLNEKNKLIYNQITQNIELDFLTANIALENKLEIINNEYTIANDILTKNNVRVSEDLFLIFNEQGELVAFRNEYANLITQIKFQLTELEEIYSNIKAKVNNAFVPTNNLLSSINLKTNNIEITNIVRSTSLLKLIVFSLVIFLILSILFFSFLYLINLNKKSIKK